MSRRLIARYISCPIDMDAVHVFDAVSRERLYEIVFIVKICPCCIDDNFIFRILVCRSLHLRSDIETLTGEQADTVMQNVLSACKAEFQATLLQ